MAEKSVRAGGVDEVARKRRFAYPRSKPFAVWVIFGCLAYFGIGIFVAALPFAIGLGFGNSLVLLFTFLTVLCLSAAVLILRAKWWSFAFAAGVCIFILATSYAEIARALSSSAQPDFWLALTGTPGLVLALGLSVLCLLKTKTGVATTRYLASPYSGAGLATFAVVGFVVGGLIFGNMSVPAVPGCSDLGGDVCVVRNASSPDVQEPFSPATFSIGVGGTVRWVNGDLMVHTVTSDTGAFDSGGVSPSGHWEFTFSTPGTYSYHCTPHPWMNGTIVVGG